MNRTEELRVASDLARAAGAIAVRLQRPDLVVEHKEANEPVTRADREASELILAGLGKAFPHDLLVSEEAPIDVAALLTAPRVWFVDPIDGTRDYIRGDPGYVIMIGLAEAGRPCLAAIYWPAGDELYLAAPGHGARLIDRNGEHPLTCSTTTELARARLVASKSHRTKAVDRVKTALGISDELNVGSVGIKLGLIARGDRDLYVNPSPNTKAWDTCAPEALLTQAGGVITDLDGAPLSYRGPDVRHHRGLVASNRVLHPIVLARLRPIFATGSGS